MIWRPSWFLFIFQNGQNKAISKGIQSSHLGAINKSKQTADVSKMHLGSFTWCISTSKCQISWNFYIKDGVFGLELCFLWYWELLGKGLYLSHLEWQSSNFLGLGHSSNT
jgi:hypothetical protein